MRTSSLRRSGVDHTVLPANTPHLPLPRSSPGVVVLRATEQEISVALWAQHRPMGPLLVVLGTGRWIDSVLRLIWNKKCFWRYLLQLRPPVHDHNPDWICVGLRSFECFLLMTDGNHYSVAAVSLHFALCHFFVKIILTSLNLVEGLAWWDWPFTWWTDQLLFFSAWHCWLGLLTRKNRPRYDL